MIFILKLFRLFLTVHVALFKHWKQKPYRFWKDIFNDFEHTENIQQSIPNYFPNISNACSSIEYLKRYFE